MVRSLPVISLATSLALACHHPAPVGTPERTAVKVSRITTSGATKGTRYSAHIEPASRVDLAFRVGGYVETLATAPGFDGKPRPIQEGDLVREGQALATIRKSDYVQRLSEAKAAYEQAKGAFEQAKRDEERTQQLLTTSSVSTQTSETTQTKLRTASAGLDGARARVQEATTAAADTTLRSPMAGVILERKIEVGTLAAPGAVAFIIADMSSVKAVFAVPDSALSRVQLGASQSVTTEAYPGVNFSGRISRISPSADPKSLVFEAEVLIPNADGKLRSGTVAALSLDGIRDAAAADLPLAPLAAIVRDPRKARAFAVFVVDERSRPPIARAQEVELGEYLGRVIPVTRGLRGGERVVVMGAGLLSDGEPVEIIP